MTFKIIFFIPFMLKTSKNSMLNFKQNSPATADRLLVRYKPYGVYSIREKLCLSDIKT